MDYPAWRSYRFPELQNRPAATLERNPQEARRVLSLFAVLSKSTTVHTGAKSGEGEDQPKKVSEEQGLESLRVLFPMQ
jgi:hypothetical protein